MNPEGFDFRLSPDSPCIDAGNPEGPFDSDGSRKDLGAFPFVGQTVDPKLTFIRGDFNNNERLEIGDPILLLLHVFAGKEHNCPKAGDADDSGELNVGDAITLLTRLFLGGDVLPEPNILSGCGEDTTDDELVCEEAQCSPLTP